MVSCIIKIYMGRPDKRHKKNQSWKPYIDYSFMIDTLIEPDSWMIDIPAPSPHSKLQLVQEVKIKRGSHRTLAVDGKTEVPLNQIQRNKDSKLY